MTSYKLIGHKFRTLFQFLVGVVVEKNDDFGHIALCIKDLLRDIYSAGFRFRLFLCSFCGLSILLHTRLGGRNSLVLVIIEQCRACASGEHLALACNQPFQVEGGVLSGHVDKEVESRLIASGEDMRYAGSRNTDAVGELGLADVFGLEKLL